MNGTETRDRIVRRIRAAAPGLVLGVLLLLAPPRAGGDEPARPEAGTFPVAGPVVRISAELIQVDVSVLDKDGLPVTGLTEADFEVTLNGEPRPVTRALFVPRRPGYDFTAPAATEAGGVGEAALPSPAGAAPAGPAQRPVILMVDDLGMSFESMTRVRAALRRFVEKTMQPGDAVALVCTGPNLGSCRPFTSDKARLLEAIDRLRYEKLGRSGIEAVPPLESSRTVSLRVVDPGEDEGGTGTSDRLEERTALWTEMATLGTLRALETVVRRLPELPGRKSVLLFSDGFEYGGRNQDFRLEEAFQRLVDQANNGAVRVYTVDARGLAYTGLAARDRGYDPAARGQQTMVVTDPMTKTSRTVITTGNEAARANAYAAQDSGLYSLADGTGGLFVRNTNVLDKAIDRMLADQEGYYLLAFPPTPAAFEPAGGKPRFNEIRVRAKASGARLRFRKGFFGIPDRQPPPAAGSRVQQLLQIAASPVHWNTLGVAARAFVRWTPDGGARVRTLVRLAGDRIEFVPAEGGKFTARLDLLGVALDSRGKCLNMQDKAVTVTVSAANLRRVRREGLLLWYDVVLEKGACQLRVAARDAGSLASGMDLVYLELERPSGKDVRLSSLVLQRAGAGKPPADLLGETPDAFRTEAVTGRFAPGADVEVGGWLDNLPPGAGGIPAGRLQLVRDGRMVQEASPFALEAGAAWTGPGVPVRGRFTLDAGLAPGSYTLRLEVADPARPGKGSARQETRLEIAG